MYINPEGEYPRFVGDLQLANPEWSEGEPLPEGWISVEEGEIPVLGENEAFQEDFPVLVDGIYYRNIVARPLTEEELAIKNAPVTAKAKLVELGFSDAEIMAIAQGMVR